MAENQTLTSLPSRDCSEVQLGRGQGIWTVRMWERERERRANLLHAWASACYQSQPCPFLPQSGILDTQLFDTASRAVDRVTQLPSLRCLKAGRCGGEVRLGRSTGQIGVMSASCSLGTMQGAALRAAVGCYRQVLGTFPLDGVGGPMQGSGRGRKQNGRASAIVNATQKGITNRTNTAKQQRLAQDETVCRYGSGRER